MEIDEVLEQLKEIHHKVSRSEIYQGYRSVLMATIGGLTFLAAFIQSKFMPTAGPKTFVCFWVVVAAINMAIPFSHVVFHFVAFESPLERLKTRNAVGQFLPCLVAGAFLTFAIYQISEASIVFLPGLWSLLFGMGAYASRPYLPQAIHWMAASFFVGGVILLALVPTGQSLSPWGMGMDFGFGLLLGAFVLYINIERRGHEPQE